MSLLLLFVGASSGPVTTFTTVCDTSVDDGNEDRTITDTNEDRTVTSTNEVRTVECC